MIKPAGTKTIVVDWLNKLEIIVITKEHQHKKFVEHNSITNETFCNLWIDSNGAASVVKYDDLSHFVLCFPKKDRRVIIHECAHMAMFIFDDKGIDISVDNTETFSFFLDWLCEQVFKILGM